MLLGVFTMDSLHHQFLLMDQTDSIPLDFSPSYFYQYNHQSFLFCLTKLILSFLKSIFRFDLVVHSSSLSLLPDTQSISLYKLSSLRLTNPSFFMCSSSEMERTDDLYVLITCCFSSSTVNEETITWYCHGFELVYDHSHYVFSFLCFK